MDADPIEVALREIAETRHLLELLITSSESFDYFRAKAALEELKVKLKVLSRVQAELATHRRPLPDRVIPFPSPARPAL